MKLIVPCAGLSTRFPGLRPKWMLTAPNGELMIKESLKSLKFSPQELIITILKEHEDKYSISNGLYQSFGPDITIHVLQQRTTSQAESVYMTIKNLSLKADESIFIKDCDNHFLLKNLEWDESYICVDSLSNNPNVNPANKSYAHLSEENALQNIEEKKIISNFFCTGGYFFKHLSLFTTAFEEISSQNYQHEIYISHLIKLLLNKNISFSGKFITKYLDWGTIEDWRKYCQRIGTYILDIDGVLLENGSQHFLPRWGETCPILENINHINTLYDQGNMILLLTSRKEKFRKLTENQLKNAGLKYHKLIMNCMHGKRYLVNDFSNSNPFPTAVAINLPRNSNQLKEYLH